MFTNWCQHHQLFRNNFHKVLISYGRHNDAIMSGKLFAANENYLTQIELNNIHCVVLTNIFLWCHLQSLFQTSCHLSTLMLTWATVRSWQPSLPPLWVRIRVEATLPMWPVTTMLLQWPVLSSQLSYSHSYSLCYEHCTQRDQASVRGWFKPWTQFGFETQSDIISVRRKKWTLQSESISERIKNIVI